MPTDEYFSFLERIHQRSFTWGERVGIRIGEFLYGKPTPQATAVRQVAVQLRTAVDTTGRADKALAAGRTDAARALYEQAVNEAKTISGSAIEIAAERSTVAAARAWALMGAHGGLAETARTVGDARTEAAQSQAASEAAREGLAGTLYEALALNREGVAQLRAGCADQALEVHHGALRIVDAPAALPSDLRLVSPPDELRSLVLTSLGAAYFAVGDYERADRLAGAALRALPGTALGTAAEATCRNNAGSIAALAGALDTAAGHFERALAAVSGSPDPLAPLAALVNLGEIRLRQGDVAEATRLLEKAHLLARNAAARGTAAAAALNNLAVLRLRSGDDEAFRTYEAEVLATAGDAAPHERARALANLAVHDLDGGRPGEAVRQAEAGVAAVEEIRGRTPAPVGRERLSAALQAPYQVLIAALWRFGDEVSHARAFTVAEMSRARGLADTFAALPQPRDDAETQLRRQHAAVYHRLRQALTTQPTEPATDRLAEREAALGWQVEALDRRRFPAGTVAPVPPSLDQVRAVLGADELLLAYEVNDRGAFVWAVRRHGAAMLRVADQGAAVFRLAFTATAGYREEALTSAEQRTAFAELGRILLGGLTDDDLATVSHVVVVPGVLGLLPFDLLPLPSGELLGDRLPVSYVPSAATLRELRLRPPTPTPARTFLGVGPSRSTLDGVPLGELVRGRRAMRAAGSALGPADFLDGPAAEEDTIIDVIENYRYVHFACHAVADDEQPMQSALLLEPGDHESEDAGDRLSLHSLIDLRLTAEVVVCAGCQTALGRLREGEGMVGFATAFLAAGARHLLLSLWPMRDAPMARVMTAFYVELARGGGPAAALWRAKRAVRRSHPQTYADEATWAGFVIVGADPAPSLHE